MLRALILMISACDINSGMSYIPTSEGLKKGEYAVFIVEETNLKGIYGNYDVGSQVFSYKTNISDESSFWTLIDKNSRDRGWKHLSSEAHIRRYERFIPNRGGYNSIEEVRIACRPETMTITVACVQADESGDISSFEETGESSFARKVIWPKFNKIANQQ